MAFLRVWERTEARGEFEWTVSVACPGAGTDSATVTRTTWSPESVLPENLCTESCGGLRNEYDNSCTTRGGGRGDVQLD